MNCKGDMQHCILYSVRFIHCKSYFSFFDFFVSWSLILPDMFSLQFWKSQSNGVAVVKNLLKRFTWWVNGKQKIIMNRSLIFAIIPLYAKKILLLLLPWKERRCDAYILLTNFLTLVFDHCQETRSNTLWNCSLLEGGSKEY